MTIALILLSVALFILLVIDLKQTLNIKKNPALHEINFILGQHPKDIAIKIYFAVVTPCIIGIGWLAATPWGAIWLAGWLVLEIYTTINNKKLGM